MRYILATIFLAVLKQTVKLIALAVICRHPEWPVQKVKVIASWFKR